MCAMCVYVGCIYLTICVPTVGVLLHALCYHFTDQISVYCICILSVPVLVLYCASSSDS